MLLNHRQHRSQQLCKWRRQQVPRVHFGSFSSSFKWERKSISMLPIRGSARCDLTRRTARKKLNWYCPTWWCLIRPYTIAVAALSRPVTRTNARIDSCNASGVAIFFFAPREFFSPPIRLAKTHRVLAEKHEHHVAMIVVADKAFIFSRGGEGFRLERHIPARTRKAAGIERCKLRAHTAISIRLSHSAWIKKRPIE